jgi:hypothetical protein
VTDECPRGTVAGYGEVRRKSPVKSPVSKKVRCVGLKETLSIANLDAIEIGTNGDGKN